MSSDSGTETFDSHLTTKLETQKDQTMLKTYSDSYRVANFGEPLERYRAPVAAPVGRELLLRTRRCGVCHSDLHLADGYFDMGGGKKLKMVDRGVHPPLTPGHEVVGELIAMGPDAQAEGLEIGKSYLLFPWIGCGQCARCLKGQENLCVAASSYGVQRIGGYCDTLIVPDARYLLDIEGLEPAYAATLACSGLTAYAALKKKGDCASDDWLGLIGMGGVGSAGLLIAHGLGHSRIAAIDVDAGKLEWALANGAQVAVNARDADAAQQLKTATGGLITVIDFVGSNASARLGIDVLMRGGTYVIVGLFGGDITVPLPALPTRALTLRGTYTGNLAEMQELIALAKSGRIPPSPVQTIAHDDVNTALERLRAGTARTRQVIAYD